MFWFMICFDQFRRVNLLIINILLLFAPGFPHFLASMAFPFVCVQQTLISLDAILKLMCKDRLTIFIMAHTGLTSCNFHKSQL